MEDEELQALCTRWHTAFLRHQQLLASGAPAREIEKASTWEKRFRAGFERAFFRQVARWPDADEYHDGVVDIETASHSR